MALFNGMTLGGLTVLDPPKGDMEPVNFFEMHTGAGRYGWGVFLMKYGDYQSLLSAPSGRVQLAMWHDDSAKITFNVVVAGFTPFKLTVQRTIGIHLNNDVVAVHVFDIRCNNVSPVNFQMNLQVSGFPLGSGGSPIFYNASNLSSAAWTWATVFGSSGLNVDVTQASLPTSWNPRNIVLDNVPNGKAVDILAAKVVQIPGFDGTTVHVYDVGTALAANTAALAKMTPYYVFGGQRAFNASYRLPQRHAVTFRAFDNAASATSPSDTSISPNYIINVTTAYNGPFTLPLPVSDYVAVTSGGGTPLNSTELSTVASDLSSRVLKKASQIPAEYTYAGIWPVFPDGQIWGVRWQSLPAHLGDDRCSGATTTIRYYDDSPFSAGDGQRLTQLDPVATGLGGANYGINYAGPSVVIGGGAGSSVADLQISAYNGSGFYTGLLLVGGATAASATGGIITGLSAGGATVWFYNELEQGGIGQLLATNWIVYNCKFEGTDSSGQAIYSGKSWTPGNC